MFVALHLTVGHLGRLANYILHPKIHSFAKLFLLKARLSDVAQMDTNLAQSKVLTY